MDSRKTDGAVKRVLGFVGFSHGGGWREGSVWPAAKRSLTSRGCLWARADQLVCDPAPSNPRVDQLVRNYPVRGHCRQQCCVHRMRPPSKRTSRIAGLRAIGSKRAISEALSLSTTYLGTTARA